MAGFCVSWNVGTKGTSGAKEGKRNNAKTELFNEYGNFNLILLVRIGVLPNIIRQWLGGSVKRWNLIS